MAASPSADGTMLALRVPERGFEIEIGVDWCKTWSDVHVAAASALGLPQWVGGRVLRLRMLPSDRPVPWSDVPVERALLDAAEAIVAEFAPHASFRDPTGSVDAVIAALTEVCSKIEDVLAGFFGPEGQAEPPLKRVTRFGALLAHRPAALARHGFRDAQSFEIACERSSQADPRAREAVARLDALEARWQHALDDLEHQVSKQVTRLRVGDPAPPFALRAVHWKGPAALVSNSALLCPRRGRGASARCSALLVFVRHHG
mmetsp:Transcript_27495/g.88368  ORF Transcript_27495/g.88368 Transcript_27495/m.88368 type:complete len:260 (-) Transcript_27495:750-1529(-)